MSNLLEYGSSGAAAGQRNRPGGVSHRAPWQVDMGAILYRLSLHAEASAPSPERALRRLLGLHGLLPVPLAGGVATGWLRPVAFDTNQFHTPEAVEALLRVLGPFLAPAHLSPVGGAALPVTASALLVTGACTATGNVWVETAVGRQVLPFEKFVRGRAGVCRGLAMSCPQRLARFDGRGGCAHTALATEVNEE